jgi:K+-transporting ATPase C subunit
MKKNLLISLWFTLVTTVMFGLIYPLVVTALSQLLFPGKANGQLLGEKWQADWIPDYRASVHRPQLLPFTPVRGRSGKRI